LSLSGGTFGLAINPKGNLLFATAPSESSVYAFRIASSGALQTVNGSPFSTSASELKPVGVDSSGNFVYAVDVNNRLIHIFRITSTRGTLAEILGSPFPVSGAVGRPSGVALK
jgi:6-phosphogluconolactonase (cycloisomerase 2 family)